MALEEIASPPPFEEHGLSVSRLLLRHSAKKSPLRNSTSSSREFGYLIPMLGFQWTSACLTLGMNQNVEPPMAIGPSRKNWSKSERGFEEPEPLTARVGL